MLVVGGPKWTAFEPSRRGSPAIRRPPKVAWDSSTCGFRSPWTPIPLTSRSPVPGKAITYRSEATRVLLRVPSDRLQVNFRVRGGVCLRIDPPFISILTAWCTRRSSRASAMLGSAITPCHSATGSWLVTMVERRPPPSSITSQQVGRLGWRIVRPSRGNPGSIR
jgi:hypothetical protein